MTSKRRRVVESLLGSAHDGKNNELKNKNVELKNENIEEILKDFLSEIIVNLVAIKNDYLTNNDEKTYLASFKNIIGNAIDDKELLKLTSLDQKKFKDKISNIYKLKKDERIKIIGKNENSDLEKKIFLQIIDYSWRSHLQYLEQLRQVIGLRSYGQKDPLSEFKKEAFVLFEGLLKKVRDDVIKFLFNLNIVVTSREQEQKNQNDAILNKKKVGRNEKCPCGSEKKYKHCCGSV